MKNKIIKGALCLSFACCIVFSSTAVYADSKGTKISKTKHKTKAGSSFTLSVSNANKNVTWSSSNKSVVKITRKYGLYKQYAKLKGVKAGTATITAKIGKKKFKCKVTIQKKSNGGKGKTVYIADTGTKYHTSNCRFVHDSKTAVKLTWAKQNGYEPCKVCKP